MTPAEALTRLHAAGRIRSAWLPGMRDERGNIALVADKRGVSAWFPPPFDYEPFPSVRRRDDECETFGSRPSDDPATTGCLLALLREASGFPLAHVAPTRHGEGWCVTWEPLHPIDHIVHPTEHAAIVAALVAVAERLEPTP